MTDDVFQGAESTTVDIDPNKAYFEELVGENKKYKTQEDLARAAVHKDSFIEQIKRENAEMRDTLSKRMNEAEFLTKLEELSRKSPERQDQPVTDGMNEQSALKPEDIETILDKREAARLQKTNLQAVETKLKALYGTEYKARVQSQAQALGVGTDFLTGVASRSPDAFYRLLGLDQPTQRADVSAPPRSSVSSFQSSSSKKDYNYYQAERLKKGEGWYFSVPVQQEIFRQAEELGNEFGLPR